MFEDVAVAAQDEGKPSEQQGLCRIPPNDEPLLMKVDEIDCVR